MLRGRFGNTTGRPYLEGRLSIPRLKLNADISFIVDTGADNSLLMPLDALRIGIDYSQLQGHQESVGIGGISVNYIEPALLAFREARRNLHVYSIDLEICAPSPEIMDVPSLLGRDILDRWRMNYNPSQNRLTFQVLSSDYTHPLA